ncbi:MAG TPA: cobyrinic acid a,c-diamide synthase [Alphaproteobacteria bacterium]|nr:cobyrinic acid a,c-diamide synthase [Alphaproteobacteria bacterium]
MMSQNQLNLNTKRAKVIAIASGKGGVGKTSLTLNMSVTLAKQGKKVLILDADLGLGNVDVQLGVTPKKDLSHVIAGTARLQDAITPTPLGFDIIAGRSGSDTLPFLTNMERHNVVKELSSIAEKYDYIFLDIAAGVGDEILVFARFADYTALIATPDPSSITDAYAVIKLLKLRHDITNCKIIVNQAGSEVDALRTYEKLKIATERFLQIDTPLIGYVTNDTNYMQAVRMQKLVVDAFAHLNIARLIENVASKL